jgi:hypothetical protein
MFEGKLPNCLQIVQGWSYLVGSIARASRS